MSTSDVTHAPPAEEGADADATLAPNEHTIEHHGPTDRQYVIVALILGAITAMETLTYYRSVVDFGVVLMPMLLVLMSVKFYLIAAYFMHLKYDRKILRRIFLTGITVALSVYLIALTAFKLFTDGVPH
jgi:cytochrome c oxidase subunit 4